MTKKTSPKNRKQLEYAIQYLKSTSEMSEKEIAKELGVTENDVLTISKNIEETKPKTKTSTKTRSKSHELMIRHTSNKKTNNVSIMTEAASQYNDEIKKNVNAKIRQSKNCVYKIKD